MKKIPHIISSVRSFLLLFLLLGSLIDNAQSKAEVLTNKKLPITFLGVDFSKVTYIGDPGTVSLTEMRGLFNRISFLIPSEPNKYNIRRVFKKDSVSFNLESSVESNKNMDTTKIMSFNEKDYMKLEVGDVKGIVSSYNFTHGESGVGLLFVVDGLNKMNEELAMWVTYVNIDTKEVIFTEMVTGRAGGFGFRNHWAGGIASALKKIEMFLYSDWQKKSSGK